MHLSSFFLGLASAITCVKAACPSGFNRTVVNFDDLKAGSTVPNGYPNGLFNWNGFKVMDPKAVVEGSQFKPASGKNIVYIENLLGATISRPGGELAINSFYFGVKRTEDFPGPYAGSIGIITQIHDFNTYAYARGYSDINYQPKFNNSIAPLQQYAFTGAVPQGDIEFVAWYVPTRGYIVLDSVELCYA